MKKKIRSKYTLQGHINKEFKTKEKLPFKTKIVSYPKKTVLTSPGQVERKIYFIRSGIVVASLKDSNGKEAIVSFGVAGNFYGSLSSIISNEPTEYTIECVTDCVLETVDRNVLFETMKHSIAANEIYRYFLEWAYLYRLKKQRDLLTKDALTRYLELLKEAPEIIKNVPIVKIAEFLGIHPRSLSRLRKLRPPQKSIKRTT